MSGSDLDRFGAEAFAGCVAHPAGTEGSALASRHSLSTTSPATRSCTKLLPPATSGTAAPIQTRWRISSAAATAGSSRPAPECATTTGLSKSTGICPGKPST
ncbi:hypothetical protein HNR02_000068 [Amycolatopsis endophytica]|uniref:Uncharacterized protein n=1 Tax=Amycolatopsis endophytica TaxID=860233 RepID=A0A853AVS1_9PSEU|nr:hypothetical protein [Amycolatopsis endophytica]NYI86745.1 hypothetical protein [Amycolatopsis endophytica]